MSTGANDVSSLVLATLSGLDLARLADLPADVLTEAKRVAENLAALHARNEKSSLSNQVALRRKALLRVRCFHASAMVVYVLMSVFGE